MIADYDDDTHFCLKCHSTILGLDNYVTHRKSSCNKTIHPDPSKSPSPSQLLPPDEIGLKADDFFSSLKLRSSSKKVPQSTSGKNFSGILTRSKTTAVIQACINKDASEPQQSKSGKNVWIGGSQIKDLGTGDNQSKLIKAVANLERRKENASPPRLDDVYEAYDDDSDEYEYDDEESSEEDYAPPRNHTGGKWKPSSPIHWNNRNDREWNIPPPSFTGGKWKPKRLSSPPPSYTKGKWKPLEEDSHPSTGGKYPPPGHTKGKWKPIRNENEEEDGNQTKGKWKARLDINEDRYPPPSHTKGKWKPSSKADDNDVPPPTHTKGKWKPRVDDDDAPPPTHTKGKWKPKTEKDYDIPPPTHTKGKWKPKSSVIESQDLDMLKDKSKQSKQTSPGTSSVQKAKEKHEIAQSTTSTSGSHLKEKSQQEQPPSPSTYKEVKTLKTNKLKTSIRKLSEQKSLKNDGWLPSTSGKNFKIMDDSPFRKSSGTIHYWCSTCNRKLASKLVYERHLKSDLHFKRTRPEGEFDDGATIKRKRLKIEDSNPSAIFEASSIKEKPVQLEKKRKRKKIFQICTVCHSKVKKYMMGKHLISHYHCRKGDITTGTAKGLVLENIYSIILESPFQCCVCKFYCNTHEQFLQHWQSDFHKEKNKTYPGYFLCAICKQRCENSENMFDHLKSPEHLEVVSVINRSVPITIKKINELSCLTCNNKFTLNIQLLNHCRRTGHDQMNVSALESDNFKCNHCNKVFLSAISLQRHRKLKHKENYFFCSFCKLKFKSSWEAKKHRMSSSHRYATLEKKKPKDGNLRRQCEHCKEYFANFLILKEHLKESHPEHKIRCPHCGERFIVTQELTNHLRTKSCKFSDNAETSEDALKCEKCPFKSDSTAELLFHVALHDEPLVINPLEFLELTDNDVKAKPIIKYKCPLCDKFFPKHSLQAHLRLHTEERPYACKICDATFTRKNNLLYHEKNHDKKDKSKPKSQTQTPGEKSFLCSTCGAGFGRKFTLQQHMLTHSGKVCRCPEEGCFYTARKMSELEEHFKYHSDEKNYSCNVCDYKGKTMKQLKRHQLVHEDSKRYQCSICDFKTRTSSHLKRHIRLHTGAKPFNCPHCNYKCNSLENLRKHILSTTKHPGKCIYECKFCTKSPPFETNFAKDFKNHLLLEHEKMFSNSKDAASYIVGIYEAQEDTTYLINTVDGMEPPESSERINTKSDANECILRLKTNEDPVVAQLITTTELTNKDRTLDQMLPMFIIPKGDQGNIDAASDSWNLIGQYDVEESGTLVPFHSEEDQLFLV
ncbi:hypothetical protein GWI33_000152 [Rhynchophorus ferrugineus]|uniref:C2H2-type domain-containing protein n=1 Tax=Rhynchophorus ferrugineus TaxID=354439 RepID=A0A834IVN5_RHYFE|nr:hypothetical protein GWI33_000152 [Rhynchophorus ferrugineus]